MHALATTRRSGGAVALAVAASAVIWLAAFVSPVSADPPGQNGTVKIHEAPTHKNGSENANDPKVCEFVIHGFNFDAGQTGRFWIQEHKWGNGDPSMAVLGGSGNYSAQADGSWSAPNNAPGEAHASPHSLPFYKLDPGHYKLFVELTRPDGPTTYKHKVFKVECPPAGGGDTGGNTGGNTGGTGSGTAGGTATGGTATGGTRAGVLGGAGGPAAGNLPNTAVSMELAGSLGGLLMVLSGIAYSVNRRRDS